MKARFKGVAGHAGTTPMRLRADALAAAAEGLLAVERICASGADDLVGTVGKVVTSTSAFNVIVGEAEIFVDLRCGDRGRRDAAAAEIVQALNSIAAARGVGVNIVKVHDLPGCPCDRDLMTLMAESVEAVGVPATFLMSGAGHDAMVLADLAPVAMLFIRCEGGVSHHAEEQVTPDDTDYATRALINFVERLGTRYR
jgi:allantoate deiminase